MEVLNQTRIQSSVIEGKINNGYNFDLGAYISQGWEIFKKEWLTFSLYGLIVLVIAMTGIGALVTYPLMIGFMIGAEKVEKGEKLEIGDMFGGFSKNLGSLILLVLIPLVLLLLIMIPFGGIMGAALATGENSDAAAGVAMGSMGFMYFVIFIGSLFLSLALFFAPYLIYYGDYSLVDAIKTSWKLAIKKLIYIILFSIVIGAITQIGVFACGIGIIVSMSMAYVCYYPMIKDVLFDE